MTEQEPSTSADAALPPEEFERREFLKKAGRYAVVTPPAVTALLVTSMNSDAIAASGGRTVTSGGSGGGMTSSGSGGGKTSIDSGTYTVHGRVIHR